MPKARRSKSTLKASLASLQIRIRDNEKSKSDLNTRTTRHSRPVSSSTPNPRPTIPFQPYHKILLIGEGNFSFAKALLLHPSLRDLPPSNITATTFDSETICLEKYPDSTIFIDFLRDKGVKVLFNVDATCLERSGELKGTLWDRVVWNFPHAGQHPFDLVICGDSGSLLKNICFRQRDFRSRS